MGTVSTAIPGASMTGLVQDLFRTNQELVAEPRHEGFVVLHEAIRHRVVHQGAGTQER